MYVLVETNNYATKNKLQKAVFDLMRSQERKTFGSQVEVFKHVKWIEEQIEELNAAHSRCKPVRLSTTDLKGLDGSKDLQMAVWEAIVMMYYFGRGIEK